MSVRDPFAWLSPRARRNAFVAATFLALAVGAWLTALGGALRTDAAPQGIVWFEFAWDAAGAERMIGSWDETARIHAGIVLGLDYLFLVAYATAIALGCALVAGALRPHWPGVAALGLLLAWAQLAAAGFDAVENYALVRLLVGSRDPLWAPLAAGCAIPKFALVACGLAYAATGSVALWSVRRTAG